MEIKTHFFATAYKLNVLNRLKDNAIYLVIKYLEWLALDSVEKKRKEYLKKKM